jgi:uncharacterized protein (TIGR02145 family)
MGSRYKALHNNRLEDEVFNAEASLLLARRTLVYLGQISGAADNDNPTQEELTVYATGALQGIYDGVTLFAGLRTGHTVRDGQGRDWRWVDDGDAPPPPPSDNRMYDPVDSRYYDVIKSGGLYWTVENFARSSAGVYYDGSEPFPQAGKLYTYAEAVSNAPQGWRLPTEAEIRSLQTAAGSTNGMKATTQWQTANGTNTIGFALLPAGYNNGSFSYVNQRASLWLGNSSGYRFYILYSSDTLNFNTDAAYLCSIRYVKEAV